MIRGCFSCKRMFAVLSLLALGYMIVTFASRSLAFNGTSTLPIKQECSTYDEKSKRHSLEVEKSVAAPEAGVNQSAPGEGAPKTTEASVGKSKALTELSDHMRQQVEFFRDALEDAHRHILPLAKHPNCTGDRVEGEVEDMLCIPRPKFLKEVRNPCWWDPPDKNTTLRCIPFFHILGCEKCGSSDLWNRITSHPDAVQITGIHKKEANWWGWQRYGRFHYVIQERARNFTLNYTQHFLPLTKQVEQSLRKGGNIHKHIVTGDGTPSDLMDFRGWVNITQNRGRKLPHVLTPHLMKHIYPETTKFIVVLRDPIERLYSDFCFAGGGTSAKHFHTSILGAIDRMADCIRQRSVRECFFDFRMYRKGIRLHLILYTLYLTEWLKVIPRKRFLFLKTEEYEKDIYGTVKKCYKFLGLRPVEEESLRKIEEQPHFLKGTRKEKAGPMWRSTKDILEEIVRPSMHFLPELLKDDRFVWNFNSTPVVDN